MPVVDAKRLIKNQVDAIRDYHKSCGIGKASLDVSGGIDSAVMAMLLVEALGVENCIFDHTNIHTSDDQTMRAYRLCRALEVPLVIGDFSDIADQIMQEVVHSLERGYLGECPSDVEVIDFHEKLAARVEKDPTIWGSLRSTLRAPLGRAYNRVMGGGIRHGTGNECEDRFLRFYQKGGDGEVDTNPLAMLSKTEVYQLAFALGNKLNVYAAVKPIIEAMPSPDLWGEGAGHSDEAELLAWTRAPFTYGHIDPDTGEITSIGTIERVSRYLDIRNGMGGCTVEHDLFSKEGPYCWADFIRLACRHTLWRGIPAKTVGALLKAARKAEAQTRHKMNPNIPTLGTRKELIGAKLLTNSLPRVGVKGKGN